MNIRRIIGNVIIVFGLIFGLTVITHFGFAPHVKSTAEIICGITTSAIIISGALIKPPRT